MKKSWCLPIAISALLYAGCSDSKQVARESEEKREPISDARVVEGRQLAEIHCVKCHLLPLPSDLPRDRWPFAIQWMGHYLGHETFGEEDLSIVLQTKVPDHPLVTAQELDAIREYFVSASAEETPSEEVIRPDLPETELFKCRQFGSADGKGELVSCIGIDSTRQRIFVANGIACSMQVYSYDEKIETTFSTDGTQVVGMHFRKNDFVATMIGDLFQRIDAGAIAIGNKSKHTPTWYLDKVIKDHSRIAHCCVADINGDGQDDFLVSGFGASDFGSFSVFLAPEDGTKSKRPVDRIDLLKGPGTICSRVWDFDKDGDLDILALTTQGNHDLWYFENDLSESGRFRTRRIWKNRPSFGSNEFQIADLNGDGDPELVVICGNNMELKYPPTRAYHGIRVFRNLGDLEFTESSFQALPGAIRAKIADFNGDGLLDIFAISNQPDWRLEQPVSVMLLEQKADLQFETSTVAALKGTQWLSVDAADLDGDTDIDIILGRMSMVPELKPAEMERFGSAVGKQPKLMVLENKSN